MSRLELRDLCLAYPRGAAVLSDVSLTVEPGELLVVVGPTGAGKSTLLRIVAGLERPASGEVRIDGRVVTHDPPARRDIAMVFQDSALYPHLNVFDNLAFSLRARRRALQLDAAAISERVRSTADTLGIGPLLARRPWQLSGGERQRVALGRAWVRRPRVALLDEPLAQLDAPTRAELRTELRRAQRQSQVTTLLVTHDQDEALRLADRVAVLAGGRLRQVAAPLELLQRPADRFVAGFIGSPPMSFLPGQFFGEGNALVFNTGYFMLPATPADLARFGLDLGTPVALGIPPDALSFTHAGALGALRATVVDVAALGSHSEVRLELCGGFVLTARVAGPVALRPGEACGVEIDLARCHCFDPGPFGQNLMPTTSSPAPGADRHA